MSFDEIIAASLPDALISIPRIWSKDGARWYSTVESARPASENSDELGDFAGYLEKLLSQPFLPKGKSKANVLNWPFLPKGKSKPNVLNRPLLHSEPNRFKSRATTAAAAARNGAKEIAFAEYYRSVRQAKLDIPPEEIDEEGLLPSWNPFIHIQSVAAAPLHDPLADIWEDMRLALESINKVCM